MGSLRGQAEKVEMGWFGDGLGSQTMAAQHLRDMAEMEPDDPAVTGNLNAKHANADAIYKEKFKLADRDQQIGELDSDQAKLKLLNQFTQNDSKVGDPDGFSSTRCGSTVLIAAAIQGGGTDGIKAILEQTQKGLDEKDPRFDEQKKKLDALAKSMKTGDLKMSDLHALNGVLNDQLVQEQQKQFVNPDGTSKLDENGQPLEVPLMGLTTTTMKDFIAKSSTMQGYFADGHMSIDSVDADGKTPEGADNGADHYVLHMAGRDGGSAIYDPFARKDHNQLVFDPEEQKNYQRHEVKSDQIDGADFDATPFMGMYD